MNESTEEVIDQILGNSEKFTYVIWDRNTKEIIRVVICCPLQITMTGSWSNQYEYKKWTDILEEMRKLEVAKSSLAFAETAIDHALALGYVGEGSTKGLFKQALKDARTALKELE